MLQNNKLPYYMSIENLTSPTPSISTISQAINVAVTGISVNPITDEFIGCNA